MRSCRRYRWCECAFRLSIGVFISLISPRLPPRQTLSQLT